MSPVSNSRLWDSYFDVVRQARFVDLTHAFRPGQPKFPSFPDEERAVIMDYGSDGARVHHFSFVGQWGTHVDPPSHFHEGGRSVDDIAVEEMLLPLVVIDISERVKSDPDAVPTVEDITAWEARNGMIPKGGLVANSSG